MNSMGLKRGIDWKIHLSVLLLSSITASVAHAEHPTIHKDPHTYVLQKLKRNDIVFLGTTHKRKPILDFVSHLLPLLHETGTTHLGLEIASDQQDRIDRFLHTGEGLHDITISPLIDCPEYRNMLRRLHSIDNRKRPAVIALELPESLYGGDINRDEWMARSITKIFDSNSRAKVLIVVGNLHIVKRIKWQDQVHNPHGFIRFYLDTLMPHKRMVSIGQCIDESSKECDFTREYSKREGAIAMDCDRGFVGWKIGILSPVATEPLEPYELIDGVIVY
jgi:hypothetical protein